MWPAVGYSPVTAGSLHNVDNTWTLKDVDGKYVKCEVVNLFALRRNLFAFCP